MTIQRFRAALTTGHCPDNPEPLIRDPNGDYVKYDDLLMAWQESNDYQRLRG